jgi:hypothetical protein
MNRPRLFSHRRSRHGLCCKPAQRTRGARSNQGPSSLLVPADEDARCIAEHTSRDRRGKRESSILLLKVALGDSDHRVVLSAAEALFALHDPPAYSVFGDLLEDWLKSGEGLIESYERPSRIVHPFRDDRP